MLTDEELEELKDRVIFDFTSAGFAPLPPSRHDDPGGGLAVFIDQGKVKVMWSAHDRLGDAALDMREIDRPLEPVVQRHEAVRATMHIALVSLAAAFGYRVYAPVFGFGFEVLPPAGDDES